LLQAPKFSHAQEDAYLTEPTTAFQQAAVKEAAFRAEQSRIRKAWDELFSRLSNTDSADESTKTLRDMNVFLKGIDGLPSGVKKRDVVRVCRPKKFDGFKILPTWTLEVEEAYERVLREFDIKTTPQNVRKLTALIFLFCACPHCCAFSRAWEWYFDQDATVQCASSSYLQFNNQKLHNAHSTSAVPYFSRT
jgi:hypothetical protein